MNRRWRPTSRPALWAPQGIDPLPDPADPQLDDRSHRPRDDRRLYRPREAPSTASTVAGHPAAYRTRPHTVDAEALVREAILHAVRRPLNSATVHTVATRSTWLAPDDLDVLMSRLELERKVSVLRLAELARWLCRFGTEPGHLAVGGALLSAFGGPSRADALLITECEAAAMDWTQNRRLAFDSAVSVHAAPIDGVCDPS